jgi:hypothetical protein
MDVLSDSSPFLPIHCSQDWKHVERLANEVLEGFRRLKVTNSQVNLAGSEVS